MIQLTTDSINSHLAQAKSLESQSKFSEAAVIYQRILAVHPAHAEAKHRLGALLVRSGDVATGLTLIRESVALAPDLAEAHRDLGTVLAQTGQVREAVASLERAVTLMPRDADVWNTLAIARHMTDDFAGAIESFRRAIDLQAKPEFFNNIANSLQRLSRTDEAVAAYENAIRLAPSYGEAVANLACLRQSRGEIGEAIAGHREAVRISPNHVHHGGLLFALHFSSEATPQSLYDEARHWAELYADPLTARAAPHLNNRSPDRPLRIGFVSPDFGDHPVGRMLMPWIGLHDRSAFHVTCYSNVLKEDAMTARIRGAVDAWRPIVAFNDEQAAELIRRDGIDVLVDLAMHGAGGRPLLFARKPAPVQVAYLAYCSTTGMWAMDWRISDPFFDPSGGDETVYAERTWRMRATYWCYGLPTEGDFPREGGRVGGITFGCMNQFSKVSEIALEVWGRILASVPGSRMVVHALEGSHRRRVVEAFARHGVEASRVQFQGRVGLSEYFRILGGIDVALDPFPYAGGTTTCDTMWMGVPVVTLRGGTAVGRGGVSLLSNVGARELIAGSADDYVKIAVELAGNGERLREYHRTLRAKLQASPVMDAPRFSQDFGVACREMWRTWCGAAATR